MLCPYLDQCGGCDNINTPYDQQIIEKEIGLKELFAEFLSGQSLWLPFLASPERPPIFFRNKIRFGFIQTEKGISPSRHRKGEEEADIAINRCLLHSEEANRIMLTVARFAKTHSWSLYQAKTKKGWLKNLLIRQGKKTGEFMVSLVSNNAPIPNQEEWLQVMQITHPEIKSYYHTLTQGKNNEEFRDVHLAGTNHIHEKIGDRVYAISPHAFFQTNSQMLGTLYNTIRETAKPQVNQVIWDLYAGSASIGIYLSREAATVVSIENNPQNITDAELNIQLNQVENVRLFPDKVESILNSRFIKEEARPDIIIVDPPRAGLSSQLKQILPHLGKPQSLIYVSCNPLTLRRDCRELIIHGYQLKSLQGLDMFPHSEHCEMIAHLTLS